MKRKRHTEEQVVYALANMKPLKLDLKFPVPTQSTSIRLPRKLRAGKRVD